MKTRMTVLTIGAVPGRRGNLLRQRRSYGKHGHLEAERGQIEVRSRGH